MVSSAGHTVLKAASGLPLGAPFGVKRVLWPEVHRICTAPLWRGRENGMGSRHGRLLIGWAVVVALVVIWIAGGSGNVTTVVAGVVAGAGSALILLWRMQKRP